MTIVQSPQSWIKQTFFIGIIAALTACGGSGGGGGKEPPIAPPDTTPNAFTLNVVADAEPGADVVSEPITVGGINAPAAISVEGGQYSINAGDYTSSAGSVTNGQTVTVKVVASTSLETDVSATLNIGGVTSTFVVTTLADTTPPTAQIIFPPPMSMKEAGTLTVRGTAADDYSAITGVKIKVGDTEFEAVSEDNFANWTAQVQLVEGENPIAAMVTDASENANDAADSVMVHRGEEDNAFPNDSTPLSDPNYLTLDKANDRILVTNESIDIGSGTVIAVDVLSGERSVLSGPDAPDLFGPPYGIVVDADPDRNRALVISIDNRIYTVDLTNGSRGILSDTATPVEGQPTLDEAVNIALHPTNPDVAYIVDEDAKNIQKMDLVTGLRTLVSDNNIVDSGSALQEPRSILIDSANNRALVGDGHENSATLFAVDLETGVREVISDLTHPQESFPLYGARAIVSDNLEEYVLVDTALHGIVKVELATGLRSQFFAPFYTNGAYVIHDLHYEPGSAYLLYLDNRMKGIYAIDLKSAEYVVISKSPSAL